MPYVFQCGGGGGLGIHEPTDYMRLGRGKYLHFKESKRFDRGEDLFHIMRRTAIISSYLHSGSY